MKNRYLRLSGLVLGLLLQHTAFAQPVPAAPPNLDAARVRGIVQAMAGQSGARGVLFGLWHHDRSGVRSSAPAA